MHWSDFTFLGWDKDLGEGVACFKGRYELEARGILGGDDPEERGLMMLQRRLAWRGNEMKYEADEKHSRSICDEMGVGDHEDGEQDDGGISPGEATRFRAMVATGNYLAADMPPDGRTDVDQRGSRQAVGAVLGRVPAVGVGLRPGGEGRGECDSRIRGQ